MRAVFIGLALVAVAGFARAEALPVYVLSIGSGDYARSDDQGYFSFGSNEAAIFGAQRVAQTFANNGARRVVQILGRDGERVTREDILEGVEELAGFARNDGEENPLLIVYVSAHGLSDNFGYNLFAMPGNVVIHESMIDRSEELMRLSDIEGLDTVAPSVLEITAAIESSNMPFLLLIDTCFETTEGLDLRALRAIDEKVSALASDVSNIVRFMSLPRGPHPVVFSAPPGTLARPGLDPISSGTRYIAPLARRIVLAARELAAGEAIGMAKLLDALTRDGFDAETASGVTWYEGALEDRNVLKEGASDGEFRKRRGTGYEITECCVETASNLANGNDGGFIITGVVELDGDADDFVSSGKSMRGEIETSEQTVWSISQTAFDVDVMLTNSQELSIALSSPGGPFEPGTYRDAVRAAFAEPGQPGLSVTMDGNACNEIAGTFNINDVEYSGDGSLRRLNFEFNQICDGGSGMLRGTADLTFAKK